MMALLLLLLMYAFGFVRVGFQPLILESYTENRRLQYLKWVHPLTLYEPYLLTLLRRGFMTGLFRQVAKIRLACNQRGTSCAVAMLISTILMLAMLAEAAQVLFYGFWRPQFFLVAMTIGTLGGYALVVEEFQQIGKQRQRQISQELPVFLTRLILLVGAGLSLRHAWEKGCAGSADNYLYRCGRGSVEDMRLHGSLRVALEHMSQEMSDYRVDQLVKLVVQMGDYGDSDFQTRLEALKSELWQDRLRTARELAEEAKVKLLLPLFITFGGILAIIAGPIMMAMKGVFV